MIARNALSVGCSQLRDRIVRVETEARFSSIYCRLEHIGVAHSRKASFLSQGQFVCRVNDDPIDKFHR
jgi:hypothetical protein